MIKLFNILNNKTKKIFNLIWLEIVYGGHLLPIGAISIVFASSIILGIKITWDSLLIIFLGMEAAYLFNRYNELKKDFTTNPKRSKYLEKKIKHLPFLIILCSISAVILLIYFTNISVVLFGITMIVISMLYTVFFKQVTSKIAGFKDIFIGIIWGSLIFFISFYYNFLSIMPQIFLFFFVALRCFMGTSLYDLKDVKSDKADKLLTPAIILEKRKLINFLGIINIFSLLPIIIGVSMGLFPTYSLVLILLIPLSFYFLKKINKEQENIEYLSEISMGAEKISWAVLIIIAKYIFLK